MFYETTHVSIILCNVCIDEVLTVIWILIIYGRCASSTCVHCGLMPVVNIEFLIFFFKLINFGNFIWVCFYKDYKWQITLNNLTKTFEVCLNFGIGRCVTRLHVLFIEYLSNLFPLKKKNNNNNIKYEKLRNLTDQLDWSDSNLSMNSMKMYEWFWMHDWCKINNSR